ncbi:MAG: nitroreductase family protein [Dehalococcoidia bacterium]|nr:MAG: nitroreductase family protein [Dehalococcoidia bacterium]
MDFFELAKKRYSVRAYKSTPIEYGKLQEVLNAARIAPTAANRQPFQLIIIQTQGRKEELLRIYNKPWFVEAPLIICICSIPSESWTRKDGKNYCDVDVAIAMDHLILAATEQGLGTCWVGAFEPGEARKVLKLPDGIEPIAFTPLGYPNDKPGDIVRKTIEELVQYHIP